jgi:hypothetical protein
MLNCSLKKAIIDSPVFKVLDNPRYKILLDRLQAIKKTPPKRG